MKESQNTEQSVYFSRPVDIRFRHGDPAGLLFFGNVYKMAHDTYEDFVVHALEFEWETWFCNPEWVVPIRHSECDHLIPLIPAKDYDIRVVVERIGKSSFTLGYVFERNGKTHCHVRLVHTFFNKKTRTKMSIPSEVFERLESYQQECLET